MPSLRSALLFIITTGALAGCAAQTGDEHERSTEAAACGTALAEVDGIWAYSNGWAQTTGDSCAGWLATGYGYQCVELAQRYMHDRFGIATIWPVSAAKQMCGSHPGGITTHWVGDGYPPVHGDLVVFTQGTWGHVAVVNETWDGGLSIVEQNNSAGGTGTLTGNASSGFTRGYGTVGCFLHADSNDAAPPPPPPPPDTSGASCDSVGYAGTCVGTLSVYAEGGACKLRDCGAEGRTCGYISDADGWGCLGGSAGAQRYACSDLGYQGRCLSSTLAWVEGGQCKTYDCASVGKRCAWDGGNGWNCVW